MNDTGDGGGRLYKARGPDGEVTWVDHEGLWRLQQSQTERLRQDHSRRRRRAILVLGALALVTVLLLAVLWLRSPAGSLPSAESTGSPTAAAGRTTEAGVRQAADSEQAAAAPEDFAVAAPSTAERVSGVVSAWSTAWADQEVDAYLERYSDAFRPADRLSRSSWEDLRRQRLLAPSSIRLEIEELEILVPEPGRAEARFLQRYTSPSYSDVVRKTLELVEEEEGEWRIVAESAEVV
jgi:hypothetical protein